jgi:hypothetical protein
MVYLNGLEVGKMAQRRSDEKTTLEEVLKLATQLTPEEQDFLADEFSKLQRLRHKLAAAEASLDRGEGIPAVEAFDRLEKRYKKES